MKTDFSNTIQRHLVHHETRPLENILSEWGVKIMKKGIDTSGVKTKIFLEEFYFLPAPIRESVLMTVLAEHISAWSIWMMEDQAGLPHHRRSNHPFPREYVIRDRENDPILNMLLKHVTANQTKRNKKNIFQWFFDEKFGTRHSEKRLGELNVVVVT